MISGSYKNNAKILPEVFRLKAETEIKGYKVPAGSTVEVDSEGNIIRAWIDV